MQRQIVDALMRDAESKINLARMNAWILLNNPVGVGDHPNVIETIQGQLDIMSQNKDRLNILMEYFDGED
jgi:hypothetical protein